MLYNQLHSSNYILKHLIINQYYSFCFLEVGVVINMVIIAVVGMDLRKVSQSQKIKKYYSAQNRYIKVRLYIKA